MTIPEELLPVIDWWEKDGKQTLAIVAVCGIAVLGYYGVKNHRAAQADAAAEALMSATSVDELAEAASNYEGTKAGPALKLRLAKACFDAEQYEQALELYEKLDGRAPEGFEGAPAVGKAMCLEALERYDEAKAAFEAFAEAQPKSYLALTAKLGAARVVAAGGDKAKALEMLAALKEEVKDDDAAVARVEAATALVKRWEKREKRTLFDAADAAAKQLEAAAEEAAPAVEAPAVEAPAVEAPVVEAPAPEAPAPEAPVEAPAAE
ncbi:MAG: hypothetical protein II924_01005 [Kiritimatiellae bacterium]|nr:hypothetical protein [Kiritimatiellia bacterium]